MYRASSPVFDLHEFPALRRVKPLPKRRRTSSGSLSNPSTTTTSNGSAVPFFTTTLPLDLINGSMSTERLIAHAEEISKRISQSFYMSSLVADLPNSSQSADPKSDSTGTTTETEFYPNNLPLPALPTAEAFRKMTENLSLPPLPSTLSPPGRLDLDAIFAAGFEAGLSGGALAQYANSLPPSKYPAFYRSQFHQPPDEPSSTGTLGNVTFDIDTTGDLSSYHVQTNGDLNAEFRRRIGRDDEEEDEDGADEDYMDHMRQYGNTKKRKVPANAGMSPLRGGTRDEGLDGNRAPGGYGGRRVASDGNLDAEEERGFAEGGPGDSNVVGSEGRAGYYSPTELSPASLMNPGRLPLSSLSTLTTTSSSASRVGQLRKVIKGRGKLTAAMIAGLQHKEILKARKRQLAAVMGALTHGDTIALDQALSMAGSAYPFGGPLMLPPLPSPAGLGSRGEDKENDGEGAKQPQQMQIRLSKRLSARLSRAAKTRKATLPAPDQISLPTSDFTYTFPSATTDRLKATKEEVAALRSRFEAELERQAERAAKLAAAGKTLSPPPPPASTGKASKQKKAEKAQNKTKPNNASSASATAGKAVVNPNQQKQQQQASQTQPARAQQKNHAPAQQQQQAGNVPVHTQEATTTQPVQPAQPLPPTPKPKKKKRSALANASNPHHLRNYVPSRLPHSSGGPAGNQHANQNFFGPLPTRFLTAELPPRRGAGGRKKGGSDSGNTGAVTPGTNGLSQLSVAEDEWICAFCEYDLFYGDDAAFRRAVANRKKILKRRRRARERAAAAASGVKLSKSAPPPPPPAAPVPNANPNANANANVNVQDGNAGLEEDEDEYDGDPGYEAGGNGRDEFGNVPKHQMKDEGGGGDGEGIVGNKKYREEVSAVG